MRRDIRFYSRIWSELFSSRDEKDGSYGQETLELILLEAADLKHNRLFVDEISEKSFDSGDELRYLWAQRAYFLMDVEDICRDFADCPEEQHIEALREAFMHRVVASNRFMDVNGDVVSERMQMRRESGFYKNLEHVFGITSASYIVRDVGYAALLEDEFSRRRLEHYLREDDKECDFSLLEVSYLFHPCTHEGLSSLSDSYIGYHKELGTDELSWICKAFDEKVIPSSVSEDSSGRTPSDSEIQMKHQRFANVFGSTYLSLNELFTDDIDTFVKRIKDIAPEADFDISSSESSDIVSLRIFAGIALDAVRYRRPELDKIADSYWIVLDKTGVIRRACEDVFGEFYDSSRPRVVGNLGWDSISTSTLIHRSYGMSTPKERSVGYTDVAKSSLIHYALDGTGIAPGFLNYHYDGLHLHYVEKRIHGIDLEEMLQQSGWDRCFPAVLDAVNIFHERVTSELEEKRRYMEIFQSNEQSLKEGLISDFSENLMEQLLSKVKEGECDPSTAFLLQKNAVFLSSIGTVEGFYKMVVHDVEFPDTGIDICSVWEAPSYSERLEKKVLNRLDVLSVLLDFSYDRSEFHDALLDFEKYISDEPLVITHGDLRGPNIIFRSNDLVSFIDFEKASLDYAVMDIARLIEHSRVEGGNLRQSDLHKDYTWKLEDWSDDYAKFAGPVAATLNIPLLLGSVIKHHVQPRDWFWRGRYRVSKYLYNGQMHADYIADEGPKELRPAARELDRTFRHLFEQVISGVYTTDNMKKYLKRPEIN